MEDVFLRFTKFCWLTIHLLKDLTCKQPFINCCTWICIDRLIGKNMFSAVLTRIKALFIPHKTCIEK